MCAFVTSQVILYNLRIGDLSVSVDLWRIYYASYHQYVYICIYTMYMYIFVYLIHIRHQYATD